VWGMAATARGTGWGPPVTKHPQHVIAALGVDWAQAGRNRCLVPANSFAEYAPEPNPEIQEKGLGLVSR